MLPLKKERPALASCAPPRLLLSCRVWSYSPVFLREGGEGLGDESDSSLFSDGVLPRTHSV